MKITETACVRDELCRFKEEEGEGQIVSSGDSHVLGRLATLSIPTVRVEALEYS